MGEAMTAQDLEKMLALEVEFMEATGLFPPGRDIPAADGGFDEHGHRVGAFRWWREAMRRGAMVYRQAAFIEELQQEVKQLSAT